jgi:hypothetical protein
MPSLIEAQSGARQAEEMLSKAKDAQIAVQREIRKEGEAQSTTSAGQIETLRHQLLDTKEAIARAARNFMGLNQEEERITAVIASLRVDRQKAERLVTSSAILNSVEFGLCPRCLQEITSEMRLREQTGRCSLCNRSISITSDTPPRILPRLVDLDEQITEAEEILADLRREIEETRVAVERFRASELELGRQLDIAMQDYVSPAVDRLVAHTHEIAQRESELAQARSLLGQAQALEAIRSELNDLKNQQAELEDRLREARKPNRTRLEALRQSYERVLRSIDFPDFQECKIDAQSLMPLINGFLYIHTGTALKGLATVAYHLALLQLASHEDTLFPRILVIDSPAVGDLNEESHDKLLNYLLEMQSSQEQIGVPDENVNRDWQIILTTRRMLPGLERYVIETLSAPDRMLLRVRSLHA